jgi:hypothetical protein
MLILGLPIVTRSRRSDTDEEGVEVELAETGVGLPVDFLQVRSLSLSSFDIGPALRNGTHLGCELLVETHGDRPLVRRLLVESK